MLVTALVAFGPVAAQAGAIKIEICHIPPGNPDNAHTITIPAGNLSGHLAHGDVEGPCGQAGAIKIEICHIPPGNPDNAHTITIPAGNLNGHLAHGDVAGPCGSAPTGCCIFNNTFSCEDGITEDQCFANPTGTDPITFDAGLVCNNRVLRCE